MKFISAKNKRRYGRGEVRTSNGASDIELGFGARRDGGFGENRRSGWRKGAGAQNTGHFSTICEFNSPNSNYYYFSEFPS